MTGRDRTVYLSRTSTRVEGKKRTKEILKLKGFLQNVEEAGTVEEDVEAQISTSPPRVKFKAPISRCHTKLPYYCEYPGNISLFKINLPRASIRQL